MPTTTKMGIVYPASTDLVKDGATAMGTISTTVDAKTGLVLLNTTSFAGVSSQAISQFSSNFDNYKVIVNITSTSTDMELWLRFGNSNTADTTANSQWAYWLRTNAGADLSYQGSNQNYIFLASMETYGGTGSRFTNVAFDIYNPFLTSETSGNVQIATVNAAGTVVMGAGGFIKGGSTSWAQHFIQCSTGNMTGTVKTYGYNA